MAIPQRLNGRQQPTAGFVDKHHGKPPAHTDVGAGAARRYVAWIGPDGVRYPAEVFGLLREFVEPPRQPSPVPREREAVTSLRGG